MQVKKLINQTLTKDESKLKAGLAARREVTNALCHASWMQLTNLYMLSKMAEKLEATLTSFQAFFQELHELKRKNWEKIKTMERSIEVLFLNIFARPFSN